MTKNKKIYYLIILILLIFSLCGCDDNKDNENLKEKNKQQLSYLDYTLTTMMNKLNNISFENYMVVSKQVSSSNESGNTNKEGAQESTDNSSDDKTTSNDDNLTQSEMKPISILNNNDKIDWELIKYDISNVYSSWSTILLDLYKLNINNQDILDFSNKLDDSTLAIKSENKSEALKNLSELYSFLPKYMGTYMPNSTKTEMLYTKSYVLNSYYRASEENWSEVSKELKNAEDSFIKVVNDIEFNKDNKYSVDKTYILLKELQNSIQIKNKSIYFIKYKNLLQGIDLLMSKKI